jgi:hypothetical protein
MDKVLENLLGHGGIAASPDRIPKLVGLDLDSASPPKPPKPPHHILHKHGQIDERITLQRIAAILKLTSQMEVIDQLAHVQHIHYRFADQISVRCRSGIDALLVGRIDRLTQPLDGELK